MFLRTVPRFLRQALQEPESRSPQDSENSFEVFKIWKSFLLDLREAVATEPVKGCGAAHANSLQPCSFATFPELTDEHSLHPKAFKLTQ